MAQPLTRAWSSSRSSEARTTSAVSAVGLAPCVAIAWRASSLSGRRSRKNRPSIRSASIAGLRECVVERGRAVAVDVLLPKPLRNGGFDEVEQHRRLGGQLVFVSLGASLPDVDEQAEAP